MAGIPEITGGLSLLARVAQMGHKAYRYFFPTRPKLSGAERALRQTARRNEIEPKLRERDQQGLRSEAILRDVDRLDEYPGSYDGAWSRVGLCGTYHDGLQVGFQRVGVVHHTAETFRLTRRGESPEIVACVIGRIPYDRIVSINWDGDDYYGFPIFLCDYGARGQELFSEILLCEEVKRSHAPGSFYKELDKWGHVQRRR